jgi:hypothetical protein
MGVKIRRLRWRFRVSHIPAERCLTNAIQSGKVLVFPPPMKLLLALLAGLALALYILLLADGPNLLDIINRF